MLPQAAIEEALREAFKNHNSDSWKKYGSIEWIWQPFEDKDSFPSIVEGRIAYLLSIIDPENIPQRHPRLDSRLVIPLCTLYLRPKKFPKALATSDEALLEAQPTSDVLNQCKVTVNHIFERNFQNDEQWKRILSGVDPLLQLDIINRLTQEPQPQKYHWRALFTEVNYDLKTGWHYRAVLSISLILSGISVIYMGAECTIQPSIVNTTLFIVIVPLTLVFWSTLWISSNRDPTLFMKLGLIGPVTFTREYSQLLIKGFIWSGIESLYFALVRSKQRTLTFAGSGIIAAAMFASASFISLDTGNYFRAFGIFFLLVMLAFTPFFTLTTSEIKHDSIFTGDEGLSTGPVSGTFFVASVVLIVVYNIHERFTADFTALGAGIGIILMSVAFHGVQDWYQLKSKPNDPLLKKLLLKIKAFLSFPWFCWFPLTLFSNIAALHELLEETSPLAYPLWAQTTVASLIFAACYGALWHRGLYLDTRARNPFQQGHIGKALTTNNRVTLTARSQTH